MNRAATILAAAVLSATALGACGAPQDAGGSGPSGGYPLTVQNCGLDVTLEERPERVFLISDTAVPLLAGVGALDSVVAKTGVFAEDLYSAETNAALDAIPTLGGGVVDSSGHVQVSLEALIGEQPDLVVGYLPEASGITRESLLAAGIPLILPPTECEDPDEVPSDPSLDDVYQQVELYGRVFDAQDEAAATVTGLRERVAAVGQQARGLPGRTAAALFVSVGGSTPSAYGARSMAQVQMESVGLTNVFSDVDKRLFEASFEEVLAADPDVLIVLYVDGDPAALEDALRALPGAERMTAVRNGDVLVQRFRMTGPPTPLTIDGLENIARVFGSGQ